MKQLAARNLIRRENSQFLYLKGEHWIKAFIVISRVHLIKENVIMCIEKYIIIPFKENVDLC